MSSPAVASNINIPQRVITQDRKLQPSATVGSALRLLGLPDRLDEVALGRAAVQVPRSELPDAVVLTQPNAAYLIASSLPAGLAAIVPVVDGSRALGHPCGVNQRRADFQIAAPNRAGIADAAALLGPMIERMRSLPSSVLFSDDPRMTLLARLMVRNRGMEPRRDPNARGTIAYEDENAIAGAVRHAEDLVALGLLDRQFFDMLITCPRCDSGRLCARERCPACGSTHLMEEPILHHLRCAYQGPEHDFRSGSGFVCPKCRAALEYFSVDYDRPGSISLCRACGHASDETAVGFVCLDCAAESDAGEMGQQEIYRYGLTAAAHPCLLNGLPLPTHSAEVDRLTHRIRSFVARQIAAGEPFCVLAAEMEEPAERGRGRAYQQTYSFFASLMRETFTPETEIIDLPPRFFALLANDDKTAVENALPEIRSALESYFSAAMTIRYRVYGPNDVELIVGQET